MITRPGFRDSIHVAAVLEWFREREAGFVHLFTCSFVRAWGLLRDTVGKV